MITKGQLIEIVGERNTRPVEIYYPHIIKALNKYQINTPKRIAHFIAQIAHESGGFRWAEEIWPSPMLDSDGVARNGNSWQLRYEGRRELGNTEKGDGYKFRGRGLIQLTGRANYAAYGQSIGRRLTANPDLVSNPALAVDASGWFWDRRNLNALADKDDVVAITRKINGGTLGLESRKSLLAKAKQALEGGGTAATGGGTLSMILGMGGGFLLLNRLFS